MSLHRLFRYPSRASSPSSGRSAGQSQDTMRACSESSSLPHAGSKPPSSPAATPPRNQVNDQARQSSQPSTLTGMARPARKSREPLPVHPSPSLCPAYAHSSPSTPTSASPVPLATARPTAHAGSATPGLDRHPPPPIAPDGPSSSSESGARSSECCPRTDHGTPTAASQ